MKNSTQLGMEEATEHSGGKELIGEGLNVKQKEQKVDQELETLGRRNINIGDIDLNGLVDVISWQISPLRQQAKSLLDTFWLGHEEGNKGRAFSDKSVLGCRMRTKGDSIYLEWFFNRWVKLPNGKSQPFSTYIKHGKSLSYTPASLLRHAKEWEIELVLSTEAGFALVRRQNQFLAMARQNVREAKKSQDKFYADSSN